MLSRRGWIIAVGLLLLTGCPMRIKPNVAPPPPPPVVELPRQEGATGSVRALEQAKEPAHQRVLGLLAEADSLRNQIFASADMRGLYILTDRMDADGKRIAFSQQHASYGDSDNRNRIARVRELYEDVLRMDPGKPQALLGLANLALIEAMTLLTQRTELTWTLRMTASPNARPNLLRQRRMVKRKLRTALAGAQSKFQDVLSFSPRDPSAHLGMAMVMALGANFKGAKAKLLEIDQERMHPPRARSIFYLWFGFVEEQMGDTSNALKHYLQAAQLGEPNSWAQWASNRAEELYLYDLVEMEPPDEEDLRDSAGGEVTP